MQNASHRKGVEEGREEAREEARLHFLELIDKGLTIEEIRNRLNQGEF